MSDDYPAYYNAWCQVMGTPDHYLLCSWHVLRSWRGQLPKIRNSVKQAEVWHALTVLLAEMDEYNFHKHLESFIVMCNEDEETKAFGSYFESKYASRPNLWAFSFRRGLNLNTNMYLEALHKKLKYCYLDGRTNRRVDKCISALLRFAQDMMYERFIRLVKGKPTYRMQAIIKSHKISTTILTNQIKQEAPELWRVKSSQPGSTEEYTVVEDVNAMCTGCPLTCHICKACVHQFSCTCVDHLIRGNFCKHIHACVMLSRHDSTEDNMNLLATEEQMARNLNEEMENMVALLPPA